MKPILNIMKSTYPNGQFAEQKKNPFSHLKRRWPKIKRQYLEQYPILTDEDLELDRIGCDRLVSKIARKTGRSKDMVVDEISSWNYAKKKINPDLNHQSFSLYKRISY